MSEEAITNKIAELRSGLKADRLDMSFGEIIRIYEEESLIIKPEYQRAFRWKDEQKTRFIESILLGIPIPPIFVAENNEGKWELVDGLQRLSTVLSFFGSLKTNDRDLNNFALLGSSLLKDLLKNKISNDLPEKLNLSVKRSVCRVEILRWDSGFDMRYELFNRLNTGGSPLSQQEIRNCVFIGKFNQLINKLSIHLNGLIAGFDERKQRMLLEELVLRYFAIVKKYDGWNIKSNIQQYLDSFMKKESESNKEDYLTEETEFIKIVDFITNINDGNPFKGSQQFSTSNYDTVMLLAHEYLFKNKKTNKDRFEEKIKQVLSNEEYIAYSGNQTGGTQRFVKKLNKALEIFSDE